MRGLGPIWVSKGYRKLMIKGDELVMLCDSPEISCRENVLGSCNRHARNRIRGDETMIRSGGKCESFEAGNNDIVIMLGFQAMGAGLEYGDSRIKGGKACDQGSRGRIETRRERDRNKTKAGRNVESLR